MRQRRVLHQTSVLLAGYALLVCGVTPNARAQEAHGADGSTSSRSRVLDAISPESMKGHLSFLASDALEGRDTPSRGLDMAAEYIAAQFLRAGLEPAGNDGYFQTSTWTYIAPDPAGFRCAIRAGDRTFALSPADLSLNERGTIDLRDVELLALNSIDEKALGELKPEQVAGKAVVCKLPVARSEGESRLSVGRQQQPVVARLRELKAVAVVWLDATSRLGSGLTKGRLIDPDRSTATRAQAAAPAALPVSLTLNAPDAIEALSNLTADGHGTLTLELGAPVERPVVLRNVAGLLRGSDPKLKDECIIISAHYDHLGVGGQVGQSDHIYNGANDDGSGTTMVVELAGAISRAEPRPRRSILFLTFFGEEKGLLGSRYYGRHPIVPLDRTIAMINLEHMGRTDDSEVDNTNRASMTGFDYTDIGPIFERAGKTTGVEVYKHPQNSDSFFGRSDNQALADRGVPAHTLCSSFMFPDYHGLGDHWDKVNYDHMARLARTVALGVLTLADQDAPPAWNETNPKTSRYVKAWKSLHASPAAGQN